LPVTFSNTGTSPITVSSVAISGTNASDFKETDDCTTAPVQKGSPCTINVTFTASVSGSETATLTIASSSQESPQTVALSGSGYSGPLFTASSIGIFATQLLNSGVCTSSPLPATCTETVTVTNSGNAAMTISSVTVSGSGTNAADAADFTASGSCFGATVAAGSTCKVNVVFVATQARIETATLTIASNVPGSAPTVPLSGAGITFAAPSAASGGSTSATVKAGSTATYSLQIVATGGATSSDQVSLSVSCSGAPSKATCTVPTSPFVATPATPGAFTVTVTTTSSGQSLSSLGDGFMPKGMWLALIPFGVIMLGKLRKRRKLMFGLFLIGTLAAVISGVGCTGPSVKGSVTSTTGTPTGTDSLTVTATSGGVSKSTTLTLIVQ
jgi:hypothetical protein